MVGKYICYGISLNVKIMVREVCYSFRLGITDILQIVWVVVQSGLAPSTACIR